MVILSSVIRSASQGGGVRRLKRKFIDSLRLYVKGGAGGMGFPKYGGVGGAGGNVYIEAKEGESLHRILKTYRTKRIIASLGENSTQKCILGKPGDDVTVDAPTGITVYNEYGKQLGSGVGGYSPVLAVPSAQRRWMPVWLCGVGIIYEVQQSHACDTINIGSLGELNVEGDKILVAKGGIGGCKDNGFSGVKGQSQVITLELKLIADIGFVGFPNAGKSTLLKALSRARPKIASYPFTTICPNIGVISYPDLRQISLADLPGLLEGAHINQGMGHKFLRHVERTKLLLLIVDVGGFKLSPKHVHRTCLDTVILLNKELELYKSELLNKPAVLLVNKMDKPGSKEIFEEVNEAVKDLEVACRSLPEHVRPICPLQFVSVIPISAKYTGQHIEDLKIALRNILDLVYDEDGVKRETELLYDLENQQTEKGPLLL